MKKKVIGLLMIVVILSGISLTELKIQNSNYNTIKPALLHGDTPGT